MLDVRFERQFKRDYKRVLKRGLDSSKLENLIDLLRTQNPLPQQYRDHNLRGNYVGCRECHIEPDWLLIYRVDGNDLVLILIRTGTHSDLFDE